MVIMPELSMMIIKLLATVLLSGSITAQIAILVGMWNV